MMIRTHNLEANILYMITRCFQNIFRSTGLLQNPMETQPNKRFVCNVCDRPFSRRSNLKRHIKRHLRDTKVICPRCGDACRRLDNKHQCSISQRYYCECGDSFDMMSKLNWHQETHNRIPQQCTFCAERFVHRDSLTRHIRRAHDSSYLRKVNSRNVRCTLCDQILVNTSLSKHMKIHKNEKPYECSVCAKRFNVKWNMQIHQWTHGAVKPFSCKQCDKSYVTKYDLKVHSRSHEPRRFFVCNECGARFSRKDNCQRHVLQHANQPSHQCPDCGRLFKRLDYFNKHRAVHTGSRPFRCHVCGQQTAYKSNLNKHMKTHIGNPLEN